MPQGDSGEYLALPPGVGRRIRRSSVTMGCTELVVGLLLIAMTEGYGALQKSWGDSSWSLNMTVGALSPLLVCCLGSCLFRIGSRLRGDALHLRRARRLRNVLRAWWITMLIVALLIILAQVVELVTATQLDYTAFDLLGVLLQVVTAAVGTLGYLVGRNLLQPSPASLARAAGRSQRG